MGSGERADPTKAYSEACNCIRHYSTASFGVRVGSIVQGLTILYAWVSVLAPASPHVACGTNPQLAIVLFGLPIAGLILTVLLYRFHNGYFTASEFFYKAAAKMEEALFDAEYRPIAGYDKEHDWSYRRAWKRQTVVNAPFMLVGTLFVAALIVDGFLMSIHAPLCVSK